MRLASWTVAVAMALSGGARLAGADVWDVGTDNDNDSGSDNELVHGLDQVHDMAAQQGGIVEDVDWFPFRYACNSSYEIRLDGITGGVANTATGAPVLLLLDSDASTILAGSQPVSSLGTAKRISWACTGDDLQNVNYVRVSGADCGVSCTSTDQYHIHFRDTTALIPRFNNSATQVSVLVLQNSRDTTVLATPVAYDAGGALLASLLTQVLGPNQSTVINLSTVDGGVLAGKSGTLKIVNTAPYGALAGKAVAVEPATGFTFDTALSYKPY